MRGAIFDMDGLLIDSEKIWQRVWRELAAERGLTLPDAFTNEICGTGGTRTREVVSRYFQTGEPEEVIGACSERVWKIEESGVPLKPGVETILRGLRGEGYRIAVASSSPMDMVRRNLSLAGVAAYFDALASGKEAKRGKPAPDVFLLAAERIGVPPEECYVFEDSLSGVEAGHRAGCRTVMVPDLMPPTERERERCWAICRDLNEAWERIRAQD